MFFILAVKGLMGFEVQWRFCQVHIQTTFTKILGMSNFVEEILEHINLEGNLENC